MHCKQTLAHGGTGLLEPDNEAAFPLQEYLVGVKHLEKLKQ